MKIGVLVLLVALLLGSAAVFAFARATPATNAEETVSESGAVVVPEPGTVALVGLGLIGITLGTSRRRRRI